MFEPVADQESVVFVELAVVEHQKKLAAVRVEALNRMRNTGSEIPKVSNAHVIDEIPALRVNGCNARGSVEHIGPLGRLVPMQLPYAAGIETHVQIGRA